MECILPSFRIAKEKLQPGEDGKYGEITTIALHKGPPTALSPELEQQIYCFIEDCYHMLIPRSNGRLALDIQQYLNRIGMDVKSFMDRKPGNIKFFGNFTIKKIRQATRNIPQCNVFSKGKIKSVSEYFKRGGRVTERPVRILLQFILVVD